MTERPYPELLSQAEEADLLTAAETLFEELQKNELGGYSGDNRPFYIKHVFKQVIEMYGRRDTGLSWSKNALESHPDHPK